MCLASIQKIFSYGIGFLHNLTITAAFIEFWYPMWVWCETLRSRLLGNSSGQNNWHLGGSVMLYLSLQSMETIIQKKKKKKELHWQIPLNSLLSGKGTTFFKKEHFEEYEIFCPGLWLCQNHTQLVTVMQEEKEPPGLISSEQHTHFKTYISRTSGKQNNLLMVIL